MAGAMKAKAVKKAAVKAVAGGRKSTSYTGPREPHITELADVQARVVDEIPPARGSGERKWRYAKVLREIREQVGAGKPVVVAEFIGRTGASTVRRALMTGERPVDGAVGDWQFDARRGGEQGGSTLYATLLAD